MSARSVTSLLQVVYVSFHALSVEVNAPDETYDQFLFFLLAEAGAEHPSLNPFFYFLAIVFKYLILPVPWPDRLLALWDQLTKREQRVSITP